MTPKLCVLATSLTIFAALTAAVIWHNPWLVATDSAVMQSIIALRNPTLTVVMEAVTTLGTWAVYLVLLAVGLASGKQRPIKYLVIAVTSLVLAQITRYLINIWIRRPRPTSANWLVHASWYSYPSGHTALAGIGYGLATWLIWLVDRRAGMVAAVVAAALTLLVAISRVYLGVHWPSDVLGSLAFAASWLVLTIIVASALVHSI